MKQEQPKRHDPTEGKQHDPRQWIESDLTSEIISAFYAVYNFFGFGLLESVYANALAVELRRQRTAEWGLIVPFLCLFC